MTPRNRNTAQIALWSCDKSGNWNLERVARRTDLWPLAAAICFNRPHIRLLMFKIEENDVEEGTEGQFLAATKWPAQGPLMYVCSVCSVLSQRVTK